YKLLIKHAVLALDEDLVKQAHCETLGRIAFRHLVTDGDGRLCSESIGARYRPLGLLTRFGKIGDRVSLLRGNTREIFIHPSLGRRFVKIAGNDQYGIVR